MFYVYVHKRADNGSVFYVGKGTGRRVYSKNRNDHWKRIVAKYGYTIEFIANDIDEEFAFLVEQEAIDLYRRRGFVLANKTDGGEGASGYKHTEQHKDALKGNDFGKKTWGLTFLGKTHSEESRKKMSDARVGNTNKLGKKISEEAKKKLSELKKGVPNLKNRKLTDEQVNEIRSKIGYRNIAKLAREYEVGESTIRRIRDGERY